MKWRMSTKLAATLAAGAASAAAAQSITTTFASNNGGASLWTNYFDLNATNPLTITALDVNTSATVGTAFTVDVYVTAVGGTYVGNTSNPAVWTLVSTMSGSAAGQNVPSHVTGPSFVLPPGTQGVAIRYNGASPRYTDGTGANQNYSNADLSLTLGASQATTTAPFNGGTPFTPRVWNGTIFYTVGGTVGACCRADGACIQTTSASCGAIGGIYRGDNSTCANANCPQPATGACCFATGCSVLTQAQCTTQGGTYRGDNVTCAAANCPITAWQENGDAGNLPGTAQVVTGSGNLQQIRGSLTAGDSDMFKFTMCSPGSFGATTVGGAAFDTQLFLFDSTGHGVAFDDDSQAVTQSTLTNLFTASLPAGDYYIAIAGYDNDPVDASAAELWLDTPFANERAPDGPGAANPVANWSGGGASGNYTIAMTGSCFVGASCYANCDGSTTAPILNVNDFTCFLNKYAAGDSYANCDGSTTPPVLNVNDFTCFLNKYAIGCP